MACFRLVYNVSLLGSQQSIQKFKHEPAARSRFSRRPHLAITSHCPYKNVRRIIIQFANFKSRMPPPNNDAPPQNKHNRAGPAPDRPKLPTVAASPFAAARSLPSGKAKEREPAVDTGTTLEEQQRRSHTASVIRDWEVSAWYSIAGREVGLSSHFLFPTSSQNDILTSPSVIICEASYRIQLSSDSKLISIR